MVEKRLGLEPEVQSIFHCIDAGQNFLLSGGAGSGKTYSLVQVIKQIINENPSTKVACITYTNSAVKEIEERVNHKNLNVTTIHDFLWDSIKHYQKELKLGLVELINNGIISSSSTDDLIPLPQDYYLSLEKGIQYKEYLKLNEGIISHDELLIIANHLFTKYSKLSDIVKDRYKFIFIDEYQDTNKLVIEIFLFHLTNSKKKNIIGFFGDSMQSIYEDGIGDLNDYKGNGLNKVCEIKKVQNRRNPQKVIDLANKIRTDEIRQKSSSDNNAPNMANGKIKQGKIIFLYSSDKDIIKVKEFLTNNYRWDFNNPKQTKELNLTHNLIAEKAGFRNLMDIYDKDLILSYRDRIKKYIKDNSINIDFSTYSFEKVIETLKQGKSGKELNSLLPTPGMQNFIDSNPELYKTALEHNYISFKNLYVNKDQLLDDKKQDIDDNNKKGSKRDYLIRHLFKIQNCIFLYKEKYFNEFLRTTDYISNIVNVESKRILKENIDKLINVEDKTIEEVITEAHEMKICLIDDNLKNFKVLSSYVYNRVKDIKFYEFQFLYNYLEGKTPFSTQHKTKGGEFNDVMVILDNGGWNLYNFQNLFSNTGTASVLERSKKIFYVCCTRAKENLAVYYHNPQADIIDRAKEWFGEDNVICLNAF